MNVFYCPNVKILFLSLLFFIPTTIQDCSEILCSHIYDEVCGLARSIDGISVFKTYHNSCYLKKIKCMLKPILEINRVHDKFCNIRREDRYSLANGRRVHDFSIIGAHQACNHTCPTYCVDTYEPACAQIWKGDGASYIYRPMINHCHIDLLSCALAVNVTIQPLGKCFKNPSKLLFMTQVSALKSMGLLDE